MLDQILKQMKYGVKDCWERRTWESEGEKKKREMEVQGPCAFPI